MNLTILTDMLTGKNVNEYYKLYVRSQWFTEVEMQEIQLAKFLNLVNFCYHNVPFYRKHMKDNNIELNSIKSLDQVKLFPIINKEIIKERYAEFTPDNIKKLKNIKVSQTGGTTGNVLFKRTDANTRSSTWAAFKRFSDWMDLKPHDKSLILMGGHVLRNGRLDKLKLLVNNYLTNSTSFSPYDTSQSNINSIIDSLKINNYALIRSYSQFLFYLSKIIEARGLSFNLKAITTTAEPLMPNQRDLFRKVFNAPTFDQYGTGEIGGIAFECDHHLGLHITEERVLVESNADNELIITDLDNYAMPYIRYWNADQAIISEQECSCGRKSRLLKKIMGRTCDYIIGINGEFLHWAYFWHLFFDSQIAEKRNLQRFQVIQSSKNELRIRLVCEKMIEAEENLIIDNIRNHVGQFIITFSYENSIENSPSGKYRPVINKIL